MPITKTNILAIPRESGVNYATADKNPTDKIPPANAMDIIKANTLYSIKSESTVGESSDEANEEEPHPKN